MSEFLPEGKLINTRENIKVLSSPSALREAMQTQKILEATAVLCDSGHNLTVRFGSFRGIIPREEGAVGIKDGSVRDIAVISRVNRPVCFVDMETGERIKLNPNQIRDIYQSTVNTFLSDLQTKCGQYGIELVSADVNQNFADILTPFLIKRAKAG